MLVQKIANAIESPLDFVDLIRWNLWIGHDPIRNEPSKKKALSVPEFLWAGEQQLLSLAHLLFAPRIGLDFGLSHWFEFSTGWQKPHVRWRCSSRYKQATPRCLGSNTNACEQRSPSIPLRIARNLNNC